MVKRDHMIAFIQPMAYSSALWGVRIETAGTATRVKYHGGVPSDVMISCYLCVGRMVHPSVAGE